VAFRLLFRPPPSEPDVQVSEHPALQWPGSQEVGSRASRAPRSSTVQVRLPPFALCPTFWDPDYYEGSVALGLAPGRRSRISPMSYVRA